MLKNENFFVESSRFYKMFFNYLGYNPCFYALNSGFKGLLRARNNRSARGRVQRMNDILEDFYYD